MAVVNKVYQINSSKSLEVPDIIENQIPTRYLVDYYCLTIEVNSCDGLCFT